MGVPEGTVGASETGAWGAEGSACVSERGVGTAERRVGAAERRACAPETPGGAPKTSAGVAQGRVWRVLAAVRERGPRVRKRLARVESTEAGVGMAVARVWGGAARKIFTILRARLNCRSVVVDSFGTGGLSPTSFEKPTYPRNKYPQNK